MTVVPKVGNNPSSFRRLDQLLQLGFAFHHRQWIQIPIDGLLATSVPVVVLVLTTLLSEIGDSDFFARGVCFAYLYYNLLAVSLGATTSYNQRANASLSPLCLQIFASATEKYVSLLFLTSVLHIIMSFLGAIAQTVYMPTWVLMDGNQVLALYPDIPTDPLCYYGVSPQYRWNVSLVIDMRLVGYVTYLYCVILARKSLHAVLRFLGIGSRIFVVSMLGMDMVTHLLDVGSISPDEADRYLVFYLDNGNEFSISPLTMTIPSYLYVFAMVWLGLHSLRHKQVKA